ncbi:MAG: universal stress protein [Acidimicrobiales bacterium]
MAGIVIGVDGSESAAEALRWASREAALHDWRVTAVLAWGYLSQYHAGPNDAFDPDYGAEQADAALATYIERALEPAQCAAVDRLPVCDLAARALLDAAADADLVVLGARGLGGFKGLLLGSVSQHCLHHATRPTAIVRETSHGRGDDAMERIVVGIDGSETSRRALRWAVEEARLRHASVEVVHAWHLPYVGGYPYTAGAFDPAPFEQAARETLDAMVDETDADGLAAPIERILHLGDAATGVLDAAQGADLVVVGSRGLGGFAGLLLGSVGHHVAHHAPCPVVIIPPED